MKVVVIGSGISGLSISRLLTDRHKIEIVEKNKQIGGLIKCDRINGNLFHRVGGHVFNSLNQAVLDWFWNQFDKNTEFVKANRNAKILLNEKIVGYPIENYLYQLPEEQLRAVINELLQKLSDDGKEKEAYTNFKDYLIGSFGEKLYKLYFGPYNSKIWNTDLVEVPLQWLDGKLPMPKLRDILLSNILKKEETSMVHSSFYYPKKDGSQFIVNRLAQDLAITCSYQVKSIEVYPDKKLSINKENRIADAIVYCGDVRQLHTIIKTKDKKLQQCLKKVVGLLSNGTSNVLCETDDTDISWLYLPEKKFKAHRIIYTGNFSISNNNGKNRKTCVVEFSGKKEQRVILEELKLLPGNLTPLAFNFEPNSYIIQQATTRQDITLLKALLKPYKIYLLGRFAEWEYYNMDKCIESAMKLSKDYF